MEGQRGKSLLLLFIHPGEYLETSFWHQDLDRARTQEQSLLYSFAQSLIPHSGLQILPA